MSQMNSHRPDPVPVVEGQCDRDHPESMSNYLSLPMTERRSSALG
jgi:hypothetical protein